MSRPRPILPRAILPRAILFDWDNTLVDGWSAIAHALNAVFDRHAMPHWSAAEAQANVRGSMRDSFPAMFGPGWPDDAALFYATLRRDHLARLQPMPGAPDLVAACTGLPSAIVSNKQGDLLRAEVAHLGWRFATVIGAGDATADKPAPAPVHLALARLHLPAGPDIWFVGDTALDMQAARAAGCHAVLLGDAAHDGGIARARPDVQYPDARHLAEHIAALAS